MTDKRDITPPEDSVPLRLVVFLMTLTCITASCLFVKTAWYVMVLTGALATIGSVVSYQYRHEKQRWMQAVVLVGVFAVGANALSEFIDPNNGTFEFWGPVVHFVAGIFALHTFDLKSRSDINLSALLGALILCFLSPAARSVYFGLAVFNYICLGTVMLYFDCMSRTLHNWLTKPMLPAPVIDVANTTGRRKPRGNVYMTMALLPLISALCFLLVPRSDNLVDNIMSSLKHLDVNTVLKMLPTASPKIADINLPRHPYEAGKNIKTKAKRQQENQDEVDQELRKMNVDKHKLVEAKDKPPERIVKEKEKKTKDKEKAKSKEKPKEPPKTKEPPKQKDSAKKDSPKPQDTGKKDSPGEKGQAGQKQQSGQKEKQSGKSNPESGGAGGGGGGGSNKNGNKHGGDGKGHEKSKRPKDNKMNEDKVDLDTDPSDSPVLVYRVNATRLFYSRRNVFDSFDGRYWKRSKDKIKPTFIDVKDPNEVKLTPKDGAAPNPQEPAPEKELSPEQEAEKELEQEKLAELSKRETGFGPDMAVDYVFKDPAKGDYHINQTAALRLPTKLPSITLTQNFEVQTDIDRTFACAWLPQDLLYKGKEVTVDDYGEILNKDKLLKGTRFSITSQFPVYNLKAMREEPGISEDRENEIREQLSNYLELPEQSEEVLNMAETFAGKTGNWFATAERICLNLRGACTMEVEKPADYKPHEDRIKDFLIERKAGNHKDFTSAYIIMCRAVGLPARMVYGFDTGSFDKTTGTQEIHMSDATSWAEVYIPDYGWVPFDATPAGVMPGVKREEGFSLWGLIKWLFHLLGIDLDEEGFTPKKILLLSSIVLSSLFLLGGLILSIFLFLRWRRDRIGKNPWQDAAWRVWNDLAKDFKKARMERIATETPTEFVERINKIVTEQRRDGAMMGYELPSALKEFFITYEAVHFGNKEGLPVLKSQAEELRKLIKANKVSEKKSAAVSGAVRPPRR